MTNPYDIGESTQTPRPAPAAGARAGIRRPLLWVLLVISAVANMVTSSTGLNVLVGVAFGLATLACIIALVVDHYARGTR